MRNKIMTDGGGALVETALSMSLLVALMFGAVEFGRLAFAAIEVNNAAKAAAQYGAQNRVTSADLAGMLNAAQNEYFNPSTLHLISPTASSGYTCDCADAANGTTVACSNSIASPACPGSYMEVTITVQTQASFDPLIHVPGIPGPFTLTGVAKQKVLQ